MQGDSIWTKKKESMVQPQSDQILSPRQPGPLASTGNDRGASLANSFGQIPPKVLSPMNNTNDIQKYPTETDYIQNDEKKQRLPSRTNKQPFAIKHPHNQSGSLESLQKNSESNSTNLTSQLANIKQKKSQSQTRSTIVTNLNSKQDNLQQDSRHTEHVHGQIEIHTSKTPKSNKNSKVIYLNNKVGAMTGPVNARNWQNDGLNPPEITRFDSTFDKKNRINSRLRGNNQQQDLSLGGGQRHDSANPTVFFKNRKSNYDLQSKLVPMNNERQSPWQNMNQQVGLQEGYEPIPYGNSAKMYQMKTSFRNYQQPKILSNDGKYPNEDSRSLKAQSQIQQQQKPYQHKDNTYSTSALKRDIPQKLENPSNQKSQVIQKTSLGNLKSNQDNQTHMKFIQNYQENQQQNSENFYDYQNMFESSNLSNLITSSTNGQVNRVKIHLQKLPKAQRLPGVDMTENMEVKNNIINQHDKQYYDRNRQFLPNQNPQIGVGINGGANKSLAQQQAIVQQQLLHHQQLSNSNQKRKSKNFFKLDQNQSGSDLANQQQQIMNQLYTNTYTHGVPNQSPTLQQNKKLISANQSEKMNSKTHSETMQAGIQFGESQFRQQEMAITAKKKNTFSIHKQNGVNAKQQFRDFNNTKKSLSYTNGNPTIPHGLDQEASLTEVTARGSGPPNLSKLLLTPWSERQAIPDLKAQKEENLAAKEFNRITQISQMSQNGLKLHNDLGKKAQQFQPSMYALDNLMKTNTNRTIVGDEQYKKQQNTIHNMILNIISGSSGDQIQKNLSNSKSLLSKNIAHMGLLSGLNEHQLRQLILNYYQQGMQKDQPNNQYMQSSMGNQKAIRQSNVYANNLGLISNVQTSDAIPEQNASNEGSIFQSGSKDNKNSKTNSNKNIELKVAESSAELNANKQQQNHFYMSLNYQGGQMMANIDGIQAPNEEQLITSGADTTPTPKLESQKLNVDAERKILSNRQKLASKVNKNINIIGEESEQQQSPYDGMFNIGVKKIHNTKVSKNLFGESSSPVASLASGKGISQSLIQKEHQEYVNGIMNQKKYQNNAESKDEMDATDKQIISDIAKSMTQYTSTSEGKFVNQLKGGSANQQQKVLHNSSVPTSQSNMKQVSSLQPTGSISNSKVLSNHENNQLQGNGGYTLTTKANTNAMATVTTKSPLKSAEQGNNQSQKITSSAPSNQASTMPNTKQSPRTQKPENKNQMQTAREKNDFNLEYAQLIAKQFPIHDENGQLIDYSNINEFQLELLALHEEYGEETDMNVKKKIFMRLQHMNQEEYFRCKRLGIPYLKNYPDHTSGGDKKVSKTGLPLRQGAGARPFGNHVGKDGGNPEYKKNVIQLEKERLEREKQELIMKRKRNSNYIQQCIRHGNEHYNGDRLNSLVWLKKDKPQEDDSDHHHSIIANKLDEKNLEILRKKQEIMATYNKMSKQNKPSFADDGLYRYSMVKGNNSALVEKVLKTRDHWVELEEKHLTLYSFKWSPTSKYINWDQLGAHGQRKLVNHIQGHDLLTTKDQLYKNMHKYLEGNKVNVFQYLPIQFVLDLSAKNFITEVDKFCKYYNCLEKVKIKANGDKDFDSQIKEINASIIANKNQQHESKYKNQVSRKFTIDDQMYRGGNVWLIKPNDFNRGRGVRLFNTLEQLRKLMKEFSLGNEMDFYMHNACCQILANEKQVGAAQQKHQVDEQQEILSPTAKVKDLNPGGKEAPNLSANVKSEVFVIQKYIESPLLIDERKFDIRLWVLVNATDLQDQKCYLFKEGYIRTSSHKFTLSQESIDQPFVHLTNNAVQQYDENYGKLEEGNQLSFGHASDILKEQTGKEIDFYQILNDDIVPIIETSFKSIEGKLNPNAKKHSFEIYGYDFMIDELLRPWLIEVNTNPCLEETSAILKQFLPRMIDDAFKLTVDVLYPPPRDRVGAIQQSTKNSSEGDERVATESPSIATEQTSRVKKQLFPVDGHQDNENLWKHIYTLKPQ